MIDHATFEAMRDTAWRARYADLVGRCRKTQAEMALGTLEGSTAFAKRLYPRLMDRSAAEIAAFHHWLRVCAAQLDAAAGHEYVIPTRGYAKGKRVKKWLWGRGSPPAESEATRATVNVDELV